MKNLKASSKAGCGQGRIVFCIRLTKLMFELELLNAKIKGVLTGYNIAMTTCHVIKMTPCP